MDKVYVICKCENLEDTVLLVCSSLKTAKLAVKAYCQEFLKDSIFSAWMSTKDQSDCCCVSKNSNCTFTICEVSLIL